MMRKFRASLLAAGIALAALCSCKSVKPQDLPKEPSFYTITVNGKVPNVIDEPELNALIKEKALERYREFEEAAKAVGIRIVDSEEAAETGADIRELIFNIAWKAGRRDWDYVSVIVFVEWNIGENLAVAGAESFTWNVENKRLLSVQDILPFTGFNSLESLSTFVRGKLCGTSDILSSVSPGGTEQKKLERITAPEAENYSVFLLEKDGVTFYFDGVDCSVKIFKRNS